MNKIFLFVLASLVWTSANAGQYNPKMKACRQDFEKYCFTVEEGGGRQMKCLYDVRDKLTPACAKLIKSKYPRYVKQHKNMNAQ
ncbi:MAG: cysteine rich repeat-containing protein [Sideroxydans sp.]|nr:cysteine rich repeat-containing protein [Sideroxydans sp.]